MDGALIKNCPDALSEATATLADGPNLLIHIGISLVDAVVEPRPPINEMHGKRRIRWER